MKGRGLPINRTALVASALASFALTGCGTHPKMRFGSPLEVKRGYAIDWTRFHQDGREVDRGDVKDKLSNADASASAMRTGQTLETLRAVAFVASVVLLGVGLREEDKQQTGTPWYIGAGSAFGMSIGLSLAAEGYYVGAVDRYNQRRAVERDFGQAHFKNRTPLGIQEESHGNGTPFRGAAQLGPWSHNEQVP